VLSGAASRWLKVNDHGHLSVGVDWLASASFVTNSCDELSPRYETRDMPSERLDSSNVVGRCMLSQREELGWSQEKAGVLIGIDASSSRARISRYELETHEPPVRTARLIAEALDVPLTYLYCEEENVAKLIEKLRKSSEARRALVAQEWQL